MPFLNVEGAVLHYEIQGQGPLLLLIHGGANSGVCFRALVPYVSDKYTVLTYSRRGHSQSALTGIQDYSLRLDRDADDAAELIKHHSSATPVFVLGNSSGAIVAYTLLLRHPNLVHKVIVHEPPLHDALPESQRDEANEKLAEIYKLYRSGGVHAAMPMFLDYAIGPEELAQLSQQMSKEGKESPDPYAWGNRQYWFERELPYPLTKIDWTSLGKEGVREKLLVGVSDLGKDYFLGRIATALAERVQAKLLLFPGGHDGFKGHAEGFAKNLKGYLET
jgi:pimeloyl-ACP methyl ester carboxylesterase